MSVGEKEVNKNNTLPQKSRKIINWVGSFQFQTSQILTNFCTVPDVLPILRVLEWGFQLVVSQFCTNVGLNCLFVIIIVFFSVGKIIYWVGSFGQWAGLIYWIGKVIYYTVKKTRNFTDPVMGNCDKKSTGNHKFTGKCPYILYINGQFTVLLQIFCKFTGN